MYEEERVDDAIDIATDAEIDHPSFRDPGAKREYRVVSQFEFRRP
jgi:hypothetical protein